MTRPPFFQQLAAKLFANDKIVTRYMDDRDFAETAFAELSKAIHESISSDDAPAAR